MSRRELTPIRARVAASLDGDVVSPIDRLTDGDRLAAVSALDAAMSRLRRAERERRAAIEELIKLGAIRSHVLVGDLGELIAAAYYGVELLPAFTPGHDLIDRRNRRVQVKTLRGTPTQPRKIIGEIKDPCDLVLAIRLDFDYAPTEAIEIPRDVAELFVGKNGKVSWTAKLVAHPRVLHITAEELVAGLATPDGDARAPGNRGSR